MKTLIMFLFTIWLPAVANAGVEVLDGWDWEDNEWPMYKHFDDANGFVSDFTVVRRESYGGSRRLGFRCDGTIEFIHESMWEEYSGLASPPLTKRIRFKFEFTKVNSSVTKQLFGTTNHQIIITNSAIWEATMAYDKLVIKTKQGIYRNAFTFNLTGSAKALAALRSICKKYHLR